MEDLKNEQLQSVLVAPTTDKLKVTKNFFTTKRLYDEITSKSMLKEGVKPHIQQYKYLYIISKIIVDKTYHKGNYVGVKLNTKELTKLYGSKHSRTCGIIKDLVEWGFIHKTAKATKNICSARYTLTDQHLNDRILLLPVHISDAGFVKKIVDNGRFANDDILQKLYLNIQKLSVNDNGIKYLNDKYQFNINEYASSRNVDHALNEAINKKDVFKLIRTKKVTDQKQIFLFDGKQIDMVDLPLIQICLSEFNIARPDQQSRVYHNLTNLKRELRQYIELDGRSMMMTDISNSQVLLSVAVVTKEYVIKSGYGYNFLPNDLILYRILAESGKFYQYLMNKLEYFGDRNKFKKDFFKDVFFSKATTEWTTPIKNIFVKEFPTVYAIINQLKKNEHRDFAIGMQRMEASIMIDTVAEKMIKEKRTILTLHDAIVCTNIADIERSEQLISNAMIKYRIEPKFNRESAEKYQKADNNMN